MIIDYNFRVAGFILCLHVHQEIDIDSMLPSFVPFRCDDGKQDEKLLDLTLLPAGESLPDEPVALVEEVSSGMGMMRLYSTADGSMYRLKIGRSTGVFSNEMESSADFSVSRAVVDMDDANAGQVIGLMLRMAFAQAALLRSAVMIHASAVHVDGRAYLFMGRSGTGKSTHAALWQKAVPHCALLNDDSPIVRIVGGVAVAYGSPWSGKTPCYKDLSFPIGGMVRLRQSSENRFFKREGVDAFVALYPGCSVIISDRRLYDSLCDTLARLAVLVPVATLDCRPDTDAALLCLHKLNDSRI